MSLPPDRPLLGPFALALLLFMAAGCAGGERSAAPGEAGSTDGEAARSDRYERRVAPFAVLDADGQRLDHPFLGGFNVPRPQIVDVDGDGAQDLFIQEETGRLIFFENTAAPDAPARLVWRSSRYGGLDVGEWYRFVDLTSPGGGPADGRVDLLAEEPFSYLRYFRNDGGASGRAGGAQFTLAKDTLRTVGGEPLFSDRQNIPNVADVDCDGRADLFVGRLDGTITRYEATGERGGEDGVPRFRLVTNAFAGIKIVGETQPGQMPPARPGRTDPVNPLGGSGPSAPPFRAPEAAPFQSPKHGANTMAFGDVDGDGDTDLLWGDYFEEGLLLLENQGSCQNVDFSNEPKPFPPQNPLRSSGYNAPAVGDLTGEGRPDLLVGVIGGAFNPERTIAANLYFYARTAGGTYEKRTEQYLSMIDVGTASVPALGDLDGDGDADLLVGGKVAPDGRGGGPLVRYENAGTAGTPRFRRAGTLALAPAGAYNRAPTLADLDGDGDLDLVTGTWNAGIFFHENTDAGDFAEEGVLLADLERGSHTNPALADLDGDGDLDLIAGETDGTLNAFRNEGTPQAPDFVPAPVLLPDGARVDRRSAPAFHDVDGDGDLDLVVGSEGDGLTLFRNEGTPQAARFVRVEAGATGSRRFAVDAPVLAAPAFADVDSDGDADLFVGARRGGVFFFEDRR